MPKIPEGEMNLAELKKLIKGYNDFMSINTKGMKRDKLIELIVEMGYTIDHKNKRLTRKKQKVKKMPMKVKMPPAPKKEDKKDKAKAKKVKKEDVIDYILKNKTVLNDDRIKHLHKGLA